MEVTDKRQEGISGVIERALICCYQTEETFDGRDFPGGPVVKNPPANAGDTGLIPALGIFHMPQDN